MKDMKFIHKVVNYFNENESTVRATAQKFGISKSSVYNYLTKILPNETSTIILARNKKLRHIRGGEATKRLWQKRRELLTFSETA